MKYLMYEYKEIKNLFLFRLFQAPLELLERNKFLVSPQNELEWVNLFRLLEGLQS